MARPDGRVTELARRYTVVGELPAANCLTIEAPSPTVLLAMKVYAARLARHTGATDPDQLLALVADAYGAATADRHRRLRRAGCVAGALAEGVSRLEGAQVREYSVTRRSLPGR